MTERPKDTKLWALVGKFAVLIGILIGIIQVIQFFSTKDAKIVAEGSHYAFDLPLYFYEDMARVTEPPSIETIEKALPDKLENKSQVASNVLSSIKINRESNYRRLYDVRSYWRFVVSNEGNKEATDLVLELPFRGYYQIARSGEEYKRGEINEKIPLGNLRPGNSVGIDIWTSEGIYDYPRFTEQKTKITSPEGVIPISYPISTRGVIATIYNFGILGLLFSFLIVMMVVGIILLGQQFVSEKQRRKLTADNSKEKSEEENEENKERETTEGKKTN